MGLLQGQSWNISSQVRCRQFLPCGTKPPKLEVGLTKTPPKLDDDFKGPWIHGREQLALCTHEMCHVLKIDSLTVGEETWRNHAKPVLAPPWISKSLRNCGSCRMQTTISSIRHSFTHPWISSSWCLSFCWEVVLGCSARNPGPVRDAASVVRRSLWPDSQGCCHLSSESQKQVGMSWMNRRSEGQEEFPFVYPSLRFN